MTIAGEIAYYLRPVNGDDSNDGTSFATAWKTMTKVWELTTTAGSTTGAANLFLVNEGGAYTGPWHDGSVAIQEPFTTSAGERFKICGLSADGNYYKDTYFHFDLSGYTASIWLNAASNNTSNAATGVIFQNIKWTDADSSYMSSLFHHSYFYGLTNPEFINCIFEDNNFSQALYDFSSYGRSNRYVNCIFRRNNSYNGNKCLLSRDSPTASGSGAYTYAESCVFEENQTEAGSSPYLIISHPLDYDGISINNSVFYNNGKDTSSVCLWLAGRSERSDHDVYGNVFFNNTGTAVYIRDATNTDAEYGTSKHGSKIYQNVFAHNNKSIEFESEPGFRTASFVNNVFYNNTVEDISSYIEALPGMSGSNYIFDPEFSNGYSGDFSVDRDSRLFSYAYQPQVPIGGSFVQKKDPIEISAATADFDTSLAVNSTITFTGSGKTWRLASKPKNGIPVFRRA